MSNEGIQTLTALLEKKAAQEPERAAFTFHNQPPCTYGDLWKRIDEVGAYLLDQGVQTKERVIIAVPNSSEFFYAFYGVLRACAVAVPVFPGSGAGRIVKLASLANARLIVVSRSAGSMDFQQLNSAAEGNGLRVLFLEDGKGNGCDCPFPEVHAHDIAFIQFTSGSVSDPKGVQLSHANIITNLRQMIAGMKITASDRFVSWLPVYHDMGLILMTMVPFYLGIPLALLPTGLNYLKTWLDAIELNKGTFTAAPDFAYRLCLLYIRNPENHDLSSLRVALNAAEPVRIRTIRDFETRFKLDRVMLPAYGLAEATVGVCCAKPGEPVKVDSKGNVSVGFPFPGVEMKILPGTEQPGLKGTGKIAGEIGVKGSANTIGYIRNAKATRELFDSDGFIKTGDIGCIDNEGNWFILGRKKNIIIQGGLSIAAKEIEELVDEFSLVRRCAAAGIEIKMHQGEQVYIFAEVNLTRTGLQEEGVLENLSGDIVRRFHESFGFRPGRVFILKSGSIPMTYNGKIRYSQLKEDYTGGTLKENKRILFPDY